jgi:tripartite-type tricarboxylate transporter receptor subunit TctC
MIKSGRVRALGVSTRTRVADFADIPPISEAGVPGFDVSGWFMVVAPVQTPPAIVAKLHDEMKGLLATPQVKEQIVKLSLVPLADPSVDEMKAFVKSEIERWGKVVEAAGIAGTE